MKTRIVRVRQNAETFTPREDADLRSAGELIRSGGLVAFPTETVYGLGGDALNRENICSQGKTIGQSADCTHMQIGGYQGDCFRSAGCGIENCRCILAGSPYHDIEKGG